MTPSIFARVLRKQETNQLSRSAPLLKRQPDIRHEAFTDVNVNLVGAAAKVANGSATVLATPPATKTVPKAVLAKAPEPAAHVVTLASANGASGTVSAAAAAAAAAKTAVTAAIPATANGSSGNGTTSALKAVAGAGDLTKGRVVVSASSGDWDEEQEKALVLAMKQFGKELDDRSVGGSL